MERPWTAMGPGSQSAAGCVVLPSLARRRIDVCQIGDCTTPSTTYHLSHPPRIHEQNNFESFERINSIRVTNGNFDSCNSCRRLGIAVYMSCMSQNFRLLYVSNLSVSNFSAHVSGVTASPPGRLPCISLGRRPTCSVSD